MSQDIAQIAGRIEAASLRIQAAVQKSAESAAVSTSEDGLAERHTRLVESTREAIRAIDGMLAETHGNGL